MRIYQDQTESSRFVVQVDNNTEEVLLFEQVIIRTDKDDKTFTYPIIMSMNRFEAIIEAYNKWKLTNAIQTD